DSTDTAKNVIAINNAGIGFSTTGWRGPFTNAWTIDGTLNADFIRAGKIRADIFETSFNAYGDQLKLSGGALQAVNNKKKIMELDKQGMKFWKDTEPIGTMGTAGGKMGGFAWPEDYEGKFINISLAEDGKAIQLITKQPSDPKKGAHGIAITHDGKIHIVGDEISITAVKKLYLGGGEGVGVTSDLNVSGKLTVKGQEIGDGSGGGGGGIGGGYPPEVTSKADKFAWDLWAYLLSKGYSKAAAAGILGNVQQETGGTMDPDTLQGGVGPGYGLVQWDGSRYPLVPPATSDGIQYVKNLMKAANITDGHASILGQSKLLDWSMYNGQWLGIVEPTSVDGFKKMTDPKAAANTFERNFERPAVAHPERQGYAQEWYNKFKDLKPSTDGWLTPVRVGYVVTQEWDQIGWGTGEIHGGIDLAPTGGGNPPIYAAKGGTVMTVGNNPALEGNYVMIDHGDNYYTYYGHMVDGSVKVTTGQKVTNSTVIGSMGATGLASGVHLHFEVRKGGSTASSRINPRDVIKF
ncbi:phage tail tip lysozyme, partial [Enterococcus sp. AZ192]|uniref:phage tail tip lysozyme n=1 Tax=unclassified Enterococcus TaxID=2608891 RepID=UPI003D2C1C92